MKVARGSLVSPSEPRSQAGRYWGYTVRLAGSLSEVFTGCPHSSGYDLMLGTSEKGQDAAAANLPKFQHLLVVFGGVAGLEAALAADSSLTAEDPAELFDQVHIRTLICAWIGSIFSMNIDLTTPQYLNVCPDQGSRTIRTEEAVLIALSALRGKIKAANQ